MPNHHKGVDHGSTPFSRGRRLCLWGIVLLVVGLGYGLYLFHGGVGIPCYFHRVTGLLCSGCGVTHLCLALLQRDIHLAYQANPMLFCQIPFLVYLGIRGAIAYLKHGRWIPSKGDNLLLYILLILLVIWFFWRNILLF